MKKTKKGIYLDIFICVLWIYACYGFIAETFIPPLIGMKSVVFFLCDIVIILLGVIHLKSRADLLFLGGFLALSLWSTFIDHSLGLVTYANGFRDFSMLFLAVPFLKFYLKGEYREDFIEKIEAFFRLFLVIQIPCSIWQFINYGAGDLVGGSMGGYHSGILSTLVFIITFYFISKDFDSDRYLFSLNKNKYLFIFWIPSFINETKISFIFIPLFFLCLMKINYKILFKYLGFGFLFILFVFPVLMKTYMSISGTKEEVLTLEYFMTAYLYDDDFIDNMEYFEADEDMPRFTKIITSYAVLNKDESLMRGEGVGHFKGNTTVARSGFAVEYAWLLFGSIPYLFFIFVQLGIIGVVLIIYYFFYYFYKGFKSDNIPLSKNIVLYLMAVFVLILFYNDSFRLPILAIPYWYILIYSIGKNPVSEEEK